MYLLQVAVASIAALLVGTIDQATKIAASRLLPDARRRSASPVRLQTVHNPQAGIGRFAIPREASVIAAGLATTAALILIGFSGPIPTVCVVGLGVAIGGGVSNMVDLIARGAIVDFVSIGRWPPFNVADVALCVGVGLTVIGLT
jgi:signal peptidase II